MYQAFDDLTTVRKQHFVEWFSGSTLDSIWTSYDQIGSATEAMSDSVDGGFEIQHSSTTNSWNGIYFNNKRQYEETGSVIIGVVKRIFGGDSGGYHYGLAGSNSTNQDQSANIVSDTAQTTNFGLRTEDTSGAVTEGSTVVDDNWHSVKIELSASDCVMTLDGVSDATRTTNLPTIPLEPILYGISRSSASNDITAIRYCEAYNT